MLGKHVYDPGYLSCSSQLKKVLSTLGDIEFNNCLDMPCGNGRNIFLLSSYFKNTVGIDINQSYLDEINAIASIYLVTNNAVITTRRIDITTFTHDDIKHFDFISTIHYYSHSLINNVIDRMKKGAFFYIETQTCAGNNYKELPIEKEVELLFRDMDIFFYKPTICKTNNLYSKSIAFKALIRKPNGRDSNNS